MVCPLCATNIGAREAQEALEFIYANPGKLTENIAKVLVLEKKYGPQLPYQILLVIKRNFPHNEEVAYLTLRMSGYNSYILKEYLTNFAKFQKQISFAADVLENCLVPRNWELTALFEQYINNKTTGAVHARWLEKLREMNAQISANPPSSSANYLIYIFYIASGVVNLLLAALFILLTISLSISVLIAVSLLCVQMVVLYRHAKKYGGRLTISDMERGLMVMFMCSIVIIVGGVLVGALVTIW